MGFVKSSLLASSLFFLVSGCSKPDNFLYLHPTLSSHTFTQTVKQVTGSNAIDIFWAIGGMTEQAANFQSGVSQFMTTFTAQPYSYRMAVVSSNTYQTPFLGMPAIFDNTDPSPVNDFVNGVVAALNGEDDEQIFDPVAVNLQQYSSFLRPNATLAVILTNDASDESYNYTSAMQLYNFLLGLKGGDASKVIVYGVFGSTDLGCDPYLIDEDWNFHGTEFENLINMTHGQAFSLCGTTFGASLAQIGTSLYQQLENPKIVLPTPADPTSVQVYYQGTPLKGGDQANGGLWYFDVQNNAVVFYNLNFATQSTDQVTVSYTDYSAVQ